jgi:hypothetical protein
MTLLWSQSITAGVYSCGQNISATRAAGQLTIREYFGCCDIRMPGQMDHIHTKPSSMTYKWYKLKCNQKIMGPMLSTVHYVLQKRWQIHALQIALLCCGHNMVRVAISGTYILLHLWYCFRPTIKLPLVLDENYKFRLPVTLRIFPSILHYCNIQLATCEQASYD